MKSRTLLLIAPFALIAAVAARQAAPAAKKADDTPSVVPFTMLPSNHMVVEAKLNGKGPFRLIFDLGAPVTLLSNRAAEASGAVDKDAPKSFLMGTRGEATVKTVEMGELKAENLPVIVLDHPALKALSGFFSRPLDGIVGYTFWAHYRTTIDYKDLKLTFSPVDFQVRDLMKDLPNQLAGPKVAKTIILAPRGLWGLVLDAPAEGIDSPGVPIKSVLTGSPSEIAGLKAGDVLTSVDGRWTTSLSDVFSAAEKTDPGKTVSVVILRDGKEMTLSVTPREGI